ncbi:MAG: AAA family ATPase [Fibrobacter sp.]|nr:AAA family ATPase [Fibrobacter sp.]
MIEYSLKGPGSQERTRIRLMSALRENRFPQAILIDGPKGIGKKLLAMELMKALQCTNASLRPCGHCFGCRMAMDSGATDNWIIPLESSEANAKKASDVSANSKAKTVEDIKQQYIDEIQKNPYRIDQFGVSDFIPVDLIRSMTASFAMRNGGVRVVVIAEADRMNDVAANAFLKTLEDVPRDTYFILTTSNREKILQTIRSRCIAVHLMPLADSEVRETCEELGGEEFDLETLTDDVIGIAEGSPGRAIYYAQNVNQWGEIAVDFIRKSLAQDYTGLYLQLKKSSLDDPDEARCFLEIMSFLIADMIRAQAGANLRMCQILSQSGLLDLSLDATALELALIDVQETISRIESRKMPSLMCLFNLSLKLFEGCR